MSTKAFHLEVVSSVKEKACFATITHFCARRGPPAKIFSDNATNFIVSHSYLDFSFNSNYFTQVIKQNLSSKRIEWLVIPVRAPHFRWSLGNLYEVTETSLATNIEKKTEKKTLQRF